MSQISAEEGALRKGAQSIETAAMAIETQIRAVESGEMTLRAHWRGQAALGYMALIDAWVAKAKQLVTSLRALEEGLGVTDQALTAQETENVSSISYLKGMLG